MNTRLTRTCFAIAALLLGSLAAQAADLPPPSYKAPAYVGPAYANWTGFYVGVNGGYGWGTADWSGPGGSFSSSPNGWLVGATVGYNFQTGTWVWGIEGDLDWVDLNGTSTVCAGCDIKSTWLGTARARLGYAGWNNWLPYITGGAAAGSLKASSPLGDQTKTQWGWTAGAGVEYAFLPNWSVKVEYLYVDLGNIDCDVACGFTGESVDVKANVVRAGLNYRF